MNIAFLNKTVFSRKSDSRFASRRVLAGARWWSVMCILLLSSPAVMADPDGLHYMVSPSSCQPVNAASEDKLELISGVWALRSGKYGFAELYCPINISGDAADWTMFQLWFRDEYGEVNRSDHGYVSADFMRRHRSERGATRINVLASSYNVARYPNGNGYGFVSNSNLPVGPQFGRNYYLHVKMWRETNTSLKIAFTGYEIRF